MCGFCSGPKSRHSDALDYDDRLTWSLELWDNERKKETLGKINPLNLADSQS